MQRQNSFSSAGSGVADSEGGGSTGGDHDQGSGGGERQHGQEEGFSSTELLTQQGSLQEAVFGVLYTLSKERLTEGWRFVVSAMILDYLQLAVFFIGNNFPWNFNFYAWYWKWLSWVCFTNLFPHGTGLINGNYNIYLGIFFTLAGFLLVSAALCVFVGINFKRNHFPYVWPIKVLKLAVSFFFELFYISTLGIFVIALDCTYYNPVKVNEKFRSVMCFTMPHLVIIVISTSASLLAMGMAYFLAVANSELDPLSEELSSQAHNRSALKRFALISLMTFINEIFPSYTKIQGIACIIMMTYLCYNYVRYMPFQTAWINGVQASFFASLSWASFLIVLMAFFFQSSDKRVFTILVWVGLLWVLPLVWGMVYLRVRHAHKVALMYRMALKPGCEPVIHKFVDELEVEVVARCGRIRDKWGDLMPIWVDTAEAVYKAGLAQFPNSAYLNIAYSSFLIHQRGAMQVGAGLLEVARKLEPSMGERFMIFVRDREEKQRSGSGADGSSHDLLSYVEFQNNFKALLDVHRQALKANRNFWRQLVRKDVAFSDLTKAFATMEGAEKRADSTFKMVLDRYPNSPKLLHAYALYLESVKSNPSRAARYRSEAARLEKATPQGTHNLALGDSAEGGGEAGESVNRSVGAMVDDAIDAVVVINDVGIMQFVNKKALEMFGYKLGQLEGKNVSALMGPPFSTHHNQYLQRLKKTGTATRVGKAPFPTVALHAHGFSFPVTLAIKALQQGEAKAYMGVFKPINEENDSALLWVNLAGHMLALNKGFGDLSGYAAADLHGEFVGSIGADDGLGQEFKHISDLLKDWQYKAVELGTTKHTFQVSLKHKYGAAFAVSGSASFAGTENVRLIVLRLKLDEHAEKLGLLSVNPAGQVVYTNAALENMLGYEPGFLISKRKSIRDLVRQPCSHLHPYWIRQAQDHDLGTMAPFSCRTGRIVYLLGRNNKQIPVRLQVVQVQAGTMRCLTATVTELEVPEADGWGGGTVRDVFNSSKRMQLLVHADGRVLALKADAATALAGFGQDVKDLCGKDISEVVQDFNKPAGVFRDWPPVPQLLSRLSHQTSKMHAAGGAASFRVGVIPSAAAAQLDQGLKKTALALSGTLPCRMVVLPVADTEVEIHELVDEGALSEQDISDGGQLHVVELRQDDLVEVNMEIDSELRVKAADIEAPYLFGHNALKGLPITHFIQPPAGRAAGTLRVEDFLGVKRSQLKRVDHQAVGDKQEMVALHADGSRMLVLVQGADKHGDGTRWLLRVTVQTMQPASQVRPSLVQALSCCGAASDGSMQNSPTNSLKRQTSMISAVTASSQPVSPKAKPAEGRSEHSLDDDGTSYNEGNSLEEPQAAGNHVSFSSHQRAKRFRRLNKMLSSPKAQQMIHTLRWASIAMLALLLGVHALNFGLTFKGIQDYHSFFNNVVDAGEACMSCSKMMTGMRLLTSATDGTSIYTIRREDPAQADSLIVTYSPWMEQKADHLEQTLHNNLFGTNPGKLEPPDTERQRTLFISDADGFTVKELAPNRQYNSSLWDLAQRFATAGRLIGATAPTPAGATLANATEVNFMKTNKNVLASGLLDSLNSQKDVFGVKLAQQTKLMIVFILVEAGGLIPLCCLALYLLLDFVNRARLRLFNVFLAVPRPVVMQLATREVQVSQDEEEGDDEDGETWLRQQQQQDGTGSVAAADKGVGYSLTATKRRLTSNGRAAYIMVSPFVLWCIVICVVNIISIFRLRGSTVSVANLVGSSLLHYWVHTAFNKAVGIAFSASASQANQLQGELGAAFPMIQVYLQGILYGDAKLGLDGALRLNNQHEQLWFGQGCLNANTTKCLRPGDPLYEDTNNGLNHLMNQFLLHAAQLWVTQPAVSVSLNTPAFEFLWAVDRDGEVLEDGLETNTRNFVSDGRNRITLVVVLQVLTMVLSVGMVVYFYFFSLVPFLLHSKKESRRVAELMSQLPADMDVESLVLSSTNQEEEVADKRQGLPASAWLGRFFACCWQRRRTRVAPDSRKPSPAGKLSIILCNHTSADNEVPIVSPPTAGNDVSTKFNKSYQEKMRHHQSERESDLEDPTLWAKHRSPRRVSFAFPQL